MGLTTHLQLQGGQCLKPVQYKATCLPWDLHRSGWRRAVYFLWIDCCEDLPTQGREGSRSAMETKWTLVISFELWIQLSLTSPWTVGYMSN